MCCHVRQTCQRIVRTLTGGTDELFITSVTDVGATPAAREALCATGRRSVQGSKRSDGVPCRVAPICADSRPAALTRAVVR
jgi:hypothetical protein